MCHCQDVRQLTWLVNRTIFYHIVPEKLASILALLFCHGNLLLFKLSIFILIFHYFWGHTCQQQYPRNFTAQFLCFSIIKSSLMIERTGQALYCLCIGDKAFFSMLPWRCLFLPIQLFFRSNSGTNLCLIRLSFGIRNKWRKTKLAYIKNKNNFWNATHQIYLLHHGFFQVKFFPF